MLHRVNGHATQGGARGLNGRNHPSSRYSIYKWPCQIARLLVLIVLDGLLHSPGYKKHGEAPSRRPWFRARFGRADDRAARLGWCAGGRLPCSFTVHCWQHAHLSILSIISTTVCGAGGIRSPGASYINRLKIVVTRQLDLSSTPVMCVQLRLFMYRNWIRVACGSHAQTRPVYCLVT